MAQWNVGTIVETVDANGAAQPISATSLEVSKAVIQALGDNTGNIYVGDSTVDSATGLLLDAGDQVILEPPSGYIDLNQVYIDAGTNDDGVVVLYYR